MGDYPKYPTLVSAGVFQADSQGALDCRIGTSNQRCSVSDFMPQVTRCASRTVSKQKVA
jgi:hypothetical protein